jgi:hypothetical protein
MDGQSVITVTGLTLRGDGEGRIKGMHFQTFFGGNSSFPIQRVVSSPLHR